MQSIFLLQQLDFSFCNFSVVVHLWAFYSNAVLAEGCKSRIATDLETVYDKLYNCLTKAGIVPVMQTIDNEVSKVLI